MAERRQTKQILGLDERNPHWKWCCFKLCASIADMYSAVKAGLSFRDGWPTARQTDLGLDNTTRMESCFRLCVIADMLNAEELGSIALLHVTALIPDQPYFTYPTIVPDVTCQVNG